MNSIRRNSRVKRGLFAALGQGTIEYALMLVFTGIGLVIVTGAAYTGLGQRVNDVVCDMDTMGRESDGCEVASEPPPPPVLPPNDPDDPNDPNNPPPLDPEEPLPPIADFVCICDGLGCTLDAQNSRDQDDDGRRIVNYAWDYGTGEAVFSTSDPITQKLFSTGPDAGFTVALTVTDDEDATDSTTRICRPTTGPTLPPTAIFTPTDMGGTTFSFDGNASLDNDQDGFEIVNWAWDFNEDGVFEPGDVGAVIEHTFPGPGSYNVTLLVTDNEGDTDQTTRTVIVGQGPVAVANAQCTDLSANLFGEDSFDQDGGEIVAWNWDLGEGTLDGSNTSTLENPAGVSFPAAQTYTVSLTVTDNDGNVSAPATASVTCQNLPPQVNDVSFVVVSGGDEVINIDQIVNEPDGDELVDPVWTNLPDWAEGSFLSDPTVTYTAQAPAGIASGTEFEGQFCISDPLGAQGCGTVTITVLANLPPGITVADYELFEGTSLSDDDQFTWDQDLDDTLGNVTYTLISGPAGTDTGNNGLPNWVTLTENAAVELTDPSTPELGLHQRRNLRYDLAPGFGTAGLYEVQACVSDGNVETCENFTINVLAPIDGEGPTCPAYPDFDTLSRGTILANQFDGMRIYSLPKDGSDETAESYQSDHPVVIFDTSDPTGGDTDLGTPNQAFGGPGLIGHGGSQDDPTHPARSGPYVNDTPLGNIIVINTNSNNSTPNDFGGGGRLVFEFDYPASIDAMRFVDVDNNDSASVRFFDFEGEQIGSAVSPPGPGDNTVVVLEVDQNRVARLEIQFTGSGGFDGLFFCDQFAELNEDDPAPPPYSVEVGNGGVQTDNRGVRFNNIRLTNTGDIAITDATLRVFFELDGSDSADIYTGTFSNATQREPNQDNVSTTVSDPVQVDGSTYYVDFTVTDELPAGAYYELSFMLQANKNVVTSNDFTSSLGTLGVFVDGSLIAGSTPQ